LSDRKGDLVSISPAKNDLEISFKYTNYRFIKIVFSGNEGNLKVNNFYIKKINKTFKDGKKEEFNLKFEKLEGNNPKNEKILVINRGEKIPLESFIIKTRQGDFERGIKIYASDNRDALILDNSKRFNPEKDY
jgi:hypothetical protein